MKTKTFTVRMTNKQLEAIKDGIDTLSAMEGSGDMDFNDECARVVKQVDAFLKLNNLPPRKYK